MTRLRLRFLACFLLFVTPSLHAKIIMRLPFGDLMVLQRGMPVPIWGEAAPGESVTVKFADQKKTGKAGSDGKWLIKLDPMEARTEGESLAVEGDGNSIQFENVLVGDVWVCIGDGNWWVSLPDSAHAEREIPMANYPMIRVMQANRSEPTREAARSPSFVDAWTPCFPQTARFSALAYYFARDVHQSQRVPVGMIVLPAFGVIAESWITRDSLAADPNLKSYVDMWNWIDTNYKPVGEEKGEGKKLQTADGKLITFESFLMSFRAWQKNAHSALRQSKAIPKDFPAEMLRFSGHRPPSPMTQGDYPGAAFGTLIAPMLPLACKGILFYHGMANMDSRDPLLYQHTLDLAARDWRKQFGQENLPILLAQLHNSDRPNTEPNSDRWASIREQQALAGAKIKNCFVACTIDSANLEETDSRSPLNKGPVGQRLALLARKNVYGESIVAEGPVFSGIKIEGKQVRVRFKKSERALAAPNREMKDKPVPSATQNSELKGFAVAGADKKWYWADAKIDGETVIAWSDAVPSPVAVRYDWQDSPYGNLYDDQGLPAMPFRSDDWPLTIR